MNKTVKVVICVLLIISILIPVIILGVRAETNVRTTPLMSTSEQEYYNLKEGLYTKKSITGPDADGNYDVTIDTYTSDVSTIAAQQENALDILLVMDCSASMSASKASAMRTAATDSLNELVNSYNVGTAKNNYKVNVAVKTFGNVVTDRLNYTALSKNTIDKDGAIYNAIKKAGAGVPFTGTYTHKAFESSYDSIKSRISTGNKQIMIFFTDGIPATFVEITPENINDTFPVVGSGYASQAVQTAKKIKDLGAEIYCVGMNDLFDAVTNKLNANTLKTWIVNGYCPSLGINSGTFKMRKREANVFLNILSSNWIPTTNKGFDWQTFDASTAKDYYQSVNINYYDKWAKNDDSWQMVPKYFTLNEVAKTHEFYFTATDEIGMSRAVSQSLIYSLAVTYKSQGSLLGDYYIKDTTSDYFEILPNSAKIYKVPYDWQNGAYSSSSIENTDQYGECDRIWGSPTDITNLMNYIVDGQHIEVLATAENRTVIDACIVDDVVDIVDPSNEVHSGNKLRIQYKVRPKDSFIGGQSVPIDVYEESGIFDEDKAIQHFKGMNMTSGVESYYAQPTLVNVSLSDARAFLDEDNVKIGYLYNYDKLGQNNLRVEYDGRYTDNIYTIKKDSEGDYCVYSSDNQEVFYSQKLVGTDDSAVNIKTKPNDYTSVIVKNTYFKGDDTPIGLVSDGVYAQFNSTGITKAGDTYQQQELHAYKRIYLVCSNLTYIDSLLGDRYARYSSYGFDDNATENKGIVDGGYYVVGYKMAEQMNTRVKVNVFVPVIKFNDIIVGQNTGHTYPVSSTELLTAFNNLNLQNGHDGTANATILNHSMNDGDLSSLCLAQRSYINGCDFISLSTDGTTVSYNANNNINFVEESFNPKTNNRVKVFVKAFADSLGNPKNANSNISDSDQIKYTFMYDYFETALCDINEPFKVTFDEFYAINECGFCHDSYKPQFLGYQAQTHIAHNSITVNKTGCDEDHLDTSFMFTLFGFKDDGTGNIDVTSMKVLNNFSIQGNGQRTISIDSAEYRYYCVVENLNTLNDIDKGWTWDYANTKLNGSDWDSILNSTFELQYGEANSLVFENVYDDANKDKKYASAYALNTMSNDSISAVNSKAKSN